MGIWYVKIGIVLVLPLVKPLGRGLWWWTASPRGFLKPSSLVLRYLLKNTNIDKTAKKKKCKFISKRRIISLMHSSVLRQIWLNSMALYLFFCFFYLFLYTFHNSFRDFQLFRPEYHWRDLSSRNPHLVHQNWYRTSFTFQPLGRGLCWWTTSPRWSLQPSS
jgi:hypothetical protein